jgi:hypothetical protein
MNEVTVSVVLVVPPIRGAQQRVKGLAPALQLQQLNLQRMNTVSRTASRHQRRSFRSGHRGESFCADFLSHRLRTPHEDAGDTAVLAGAEPA